MPKIDYRYRLAWTEKEELKKMINVFRLQEFEKEDTHSDPTEAAADKIVNHVNEMIQEAFDAGYQEGLKGEMSVELSTRHRDG